MPSEKIASMCVLHLMKHLFRQFIHDIRQYEEDENLRANDESGAANPQEVKIPAVQLFDELGKLFDKELRQSIMTASNSKDKSHGRENTEEPEQSNVDGNEYQSIEGATRSAHEGMNKRIQQHLFVDDATHSQM